MTSQTDMKIASLLDEVQDEVQELQEQLRETVKALHQVAEQAGLIDPDYDLIERLLKEYGND